MKPASSLSNAAYRKLHRYCSRFPHPRPIDALSRTGNNGTREVRGTARENLGVEPLHHALQPPAGGFKASIRLGGC
jgi:hypothetical protein